jgi:hypothetical protein
MEHLQEFCDSRDVRMRVDRVAGVIRGVKILGLLSRNGRRYLPEALARAAALYEGAKVNVNHPKAGPLAPRDYQDRIGVIRGVAVQAGEGLFGDLHFNPKHVLAEQLMWDAEHAPENVGFSHNVQARTARREDQVVVEEITRVQSVDLVADPATTRGLYEGAEPAAGIGCHWQAQSASGERALAEPHPSVKTQPAASAVPLTVVTLQEEVQRLRVELDRLNAERTAALLEQEIAHELQESGLPPQLVTEIFRGQLRAASGGAARQQLILERLQVARTFGSLKPTSRDQHAVDALFGAVRPTDAQSFASRITV